MAKLQQNFPITYDQIAIKIPNNICSKFQQNFPITYGQISTKIPNIIPPNYNNIFQYHISKL